jgi:hypothetical protein
MPTTLSAINGDQLLTEIDAAQLRCQSVRTLQADFAGTDARSSRSVGAYGIVAAT